MEDLTAKIDLYLNGMLPKDEQAAFEAEIAADPKLREEVELQRKTFALLEAAAFEETRQQVAELSANNNSRSGSRRMISIAASVTLLLGLGISYYLISNQYSNNSLYAEYAEPYPDHITTMGAGEQAVAKALEHYNQEDYAAAAKAFRTLADSGLYEDRFTIYEAVSLTNSGQAPKAITLLEDHLKTNPKDAIACEWQLVLSYLANNDGTKAKALLQQFLEHNEGYKNTKATALLDELQSFWR